jgi:glutaminase
VTVASSIPQGKMVRICSLQGLIQWSGSENVLRTMDEPGSTTNTFVLDLRRVNEINSVARSMLTEALSRMEDDGIRVVLLDPDDMMQCKGPNSPLPGVQILDSLKSVKGLKRIRDDRRREMADRAR